MLDKNLIQKKFEESFSTYNTNAIVQKQMALKLISLINKKEFKNILEIGSYTGILTELAIKNFIFENYFAIDIVDSKKYIEKLSSKIIFKKADIEHYTTQKKFDLIIANASLQWCNDLFLTIKKLQSFLNKDGILAISVFGKENLKEIKESFNVSLKYPTIEEIKKNLGQNTYIEEEITTLKFNSPNELLAHLKHTGVNSINNKSLSLAQIKNGLKKLNDFYNNTLTYQPIYILP